MSRDIRRNKRKTQGLKEFDIQVLLLDKIVATNEDEAIAKYKAWAISNGIIHCEIQTIKEVGEAW